MKKAEAFGAVGAAVGLAVAAAIGAEGLMVLACVALGAVVGFLVAAIAARVRTRRG